MNSHVKAAVAAALGLALSASPAGAATIAGLFNTGTDGSNVALVGGDGIVDNNYVIFDSTSDAFDGDQPVTFYNSAYAANDGDSRWISISSNGNPGSNTTTYRLTFDLTGLDAATAMITGSWGVDNTGVILLNGVATGNALPVFTTGNFNALHAFSITGGFASGINNLDFVVTDLGAPTALRVDNIAGSAALGNAIPEPATWAMMIGGFGLVGGAMRRRRRRRTTVTYA